MCERNEENRREETSMFKTWRKMNYIEGEEEMVMEKMDRMYGQKVGEGRKNERRSGERKRRR